MSAQPTSDHPASARRRTRYRIGALVVAGAVLAMAGVAGAHHSFPDVPAGSYFHNAVGWAKDNGITTGVGDTGEFRPFEATNRAQVVTFQHRYHQEFNPTQTLIASVNSNGTLRHSGGVGVISSSRPAVGTYDVRFARPIPEGTCWYQATPRTDMRVATINTTAATDTVRVVIRSLADGTAADAVFHLAVTCVNAQ